MAKKIGKLKNVEELSKIELEKRREDIKDALVYLTPLEKTILRVLLDKKSAISPSEIRNSIILDIWQCVILTLAKNKNELPHPFYLREGIDPYFYVKIVDNKKRH